MKTNKQPHVRSAAEALNAVLLERTRQDAKFGEQNHDAGTWALILLEELGEWAKEELYGRCPKVSYKEAVQVAAVALAIVECKNRKAKTTPSERADR